VKKVLSKKYFRCVPIGKLSKQLRCSNCKYSTGYDYYVRISCVIYESPRF